MMNFDWFVSDLMLCLMRVEFLCSRIFLRFIFVFELGVDNLMKLMMDGCISVFVMCCLLSRCGKII